MCGIAGIIAKEPSLYLGRMKKMREALRHRGPDEDGQYAFSECILGHTRLSIVDLTTGQQPMLSTHEKSAIVFNGEIYGYELIKQKMPDYPFKTTSDTEVILALYDLYGSEMLARLNGAFAFAIWDEERRLLFAARDRFGEKPFYYAFGENGEFVFASEIKAILATGMIVPRLNRAAVAHYLKHLYVHPTQTIYENIHTLSPGHFLKLKDGLIHIEKYWSVPDVDPQLSLGEAIEPFKKLFENAVKKQLVADVPVGAFLSGGLDSSTVVAVASRFQEKLKTFSFAFEGSTSELPYARQIASKYHTDHLEIYDDEFQIEGVLLEMQAVFDEPFADSSNIPTYLISKLAAKQVKVVLTGDGADELLGGYGGYSSIVSLSEMNSASSWKKVLVKYTARLGARLSISHKQYYRNQSRACMYSQKNMSIVDARLEQNAYFTSDDLRDLFQRDQYFDEKHGFSEKNRSVDEAMRFDIANYMPGDILVKIDRAAMANSLELRAPFLDVDFSSFCLSLPYNLKINDQQDKIILRKAYGEVWTESIRERKKQGFGAPVHDWLQRRGMIDMKNNYLSDPKRKIFDIISFEVCQRFSAKNNYQTWALLVLAIWMEEHSFSYE